MSTSSGACHVSRHVFFKPWINILLMITIIIDPKTDRTVIYLALCIMYHYFSGILIRSILKHANQNNFDHHRKGAK